MIVNPDKRPSTELANTAQGVKVFLVLMSTPRWKLLDATLADINLGSFFKMLIICEMTRTFSWEITCDVNVKPEYDHAEKEFNNHLQATLVLVSGLMMPGNYARELFSSKNTSIILQLMPDVVRRELLREALELFQSMRSIYLASHPDQEKVPSYKTTSTQLGLHLIRHMSMPVGKIICIR